MLAFDETHNDVRKFEGILIHFLEKFVTMQNRDMSGRLGSVDRVSLLSDTTSVVTSADE